MDGAVLALLQRRADLLGPHGLHFSRDTGHQHGAVALGILEPGAGRGAVVVDDLVAPRRNHGLFTVIGSRLAVGACKKCENFLPFFFIKMQRIPESPGHRFLGKVILRGAEPAGKHQ